MRITIATSILLLCLAAQSVAQDAAPNSDSAEESADKPQAPAKVEVAPVARDDEIAARLQEILDATGWFQDASVNVREGVVFLEGEATEENYKIWASKLAQSTQDVAAVVNRMSIKQGSIWDMSPAVAELREVVSTAIQFSPLVLFGLIVVVATWFLAKATRWAARRVFAKRIANPLLRRVVAQSAMLPVLLIGIYILLRVSGLTQLALTVLGGTGLAGLVIGIAFHDIAENFLASILISIQNPFRSGDLIEIGSHVGFVQRVSTRGTLLMTYDGNHVLLPNAIIYKSTIINYSANPNRRVDFVVGIGYEGSASEAQRIIKAVLNEHPAVLDDPESRVILDELGAATVNLRVRLWLDASKKNPDVVRSSVMRLAKQALLREGISLPDEAREVIFPNDVPVRMMERREQDDGDHDGVATAATPRTKERQPAEDVVSVGEGDLESNAAEIQRQAIRSWEPIAGTDLLENEESKLPVA